MFQHATPFSGEIHTFLPKSSLYHYFLKNSCVGIIIFRW